MNKLMKRLIIKATIICAIILLVGYLFLMLTIQKKFDHVKENVLANNPDITSIEDIHRLGHWGEFFREYVLVVEKRKDNEYRIWTSENGEIRDSELIDE
ncbi:hypothetical protein J416_13956 [Gracilibacillus halophilus YIM-C55.5]|uniref:Uncharacterized protein n=1 Tax=Gracilibacillus halophilus YIM-C55.5 TaxID=1308866 RepID=N4WI20_9BACI|nr:hypothetical protein [Gracilibacillus halophilus]ENH95822.1 hypothetical protein J416_13956 [Gracilibacillus halophilus YIM-C55.5]